MSEDSSAKAPSTKKSPARKRPGGARKKAPKKETETTEARTASAESAPPATDAEPRPPQADASVRPPKKHASDDERAPDSKSVDASPAKVESNQEDRRGSGQGEEKGRRSRNRRGGRQRSGDRDREREPRPPQQPRNETPIDVEELAKKAWHIYSTEVCEEGLRYIDEPDASKLVRRSFRMAEIFMRFEQQQAPTVNGSPSREPRPAKKRQFEADGSAPRSDGGEELENGSKPAQTEAEESESASVGDVAEIPAVKDEPTPDSASIGSSRAEEEDEEIVPSTIDVD